MRPGQTTPNELEVALLEHFNTEYPDVRVNIATLRVLTRTYTGVGSYTEFVPRQKPTTGEQRTLQLRVMVSVPGQPTGLGALTFVKDGELTTLELFSYDGQWDGVFEGFSIRTVA
jgi:hypothetical protein